MLDQIQSRCGRNPDAVLADGGFIRLQVIVDATEQHACEVYGPIKGNVHRQAAGKDPYAPRASDPPAVAAYRQRMQSETGKTLYRLRSSSVEWVNARVRQQGLCQFPVRGLPRCCSVATLHALTHNLLHSHR